MTFHLSLKKNRELLCLLIIVTGSLFGLTARGQDDPSPALSALSDHAWFFYIGTGVGQAHYDMRTEARQSAQESLGAVSPSVGFFDFPAIYRKINNRFVAGVALNISLEHTARSFKDPNSYAVHTYNPSVSTLYFPQGEIGLRWFLRGDVGASRFLEIRETQVDSISPVYRHHDVADGTFTQLAVGYGWHASRVARLLIHINAFSNHAGDRTASGLNFNVGFLF